MGFISFEFALFLPIVFLLYWYIKKYSGQNILLLTASLFFYGYANWHFLFLFLVNTLLNFFIGIKIADSSIEKNKRRLLWLGLIINIGTLAYFKYFNFFYDSFVDIFNVFGAQLNHSSLKIILPLGISFFTFQTLGYIIDIYNEEITPCRNIITFSTYVTYFPKLLAGPIERAQKFIPQIELKRTFDYELAMEGCRQILWGLFAKITIADNCAFWANKIFDHHGSYSGSTLLVGSFLYIIQIYADFSGYSNIAIGISKLFGIRLMRNFATPFFSINIRDFWSKWHISLSSWMMEYIFTPLSFLLRRHPKMGLIISILTTFIIVGLWHGANWTFIVFGFLQGLYFVPLIYKGTINKSPMISEGKLIPSAQDFFKMLGLFCVQMLSFTLLRVSNIGEAMKYFSNMISPSLFQLPEIRPAIPILFIGIFILVEWVCREKEFALSKTNIKYSGIIRWSLYLLLAIVIYSSYGKQEQFIYFNF